MRKFWVQWGDLFDDVRIEAEELIEAGDRIVSRLHVTGSGKGSGIEVDQRVYQVVAFRSGLDLAVDEFYGPRPRPSRAAGCSESLRPSRLCMP